jgi:HD superfamily phosphohydrolase
MNNSEGKSGLSGPPPVVTLLEELCQEWLKPQMERLRSHRHSARPKVFNDAIWGSIRLYSWEVALLDTFLLQRLRFLKQLGVVHWVFPSAGHTRLEHSLGVVHQMQALLDGLERNSGLAGERVVDDVTANLLRIAALVHDTGHSAMSHVSEPVVDRLPEIKELVEWTTEQYGTRKPPLASEAIAAAFVQAPAFREFLGMRETGADFILDVDDAAKKIASFIVSGQVETGKEFLALLLNGAFDADKLDYMPRDCFMAGVPCALDVERLVEKIHCLQVSPDRLPETYQKWAPLSKGGHYRVLALSRAGARALDEVGMTRSILYDKVYYHPKVRVLEAMVRRLLEEMQQEGLLQTVTEWLKLTDEDLIRADLPLAKKLRSRHLLKRAFSITAPEETAITEDAAITETDGEWEKLAKSKGSLRQWRRIRDDYNNGKLRQKIETLSYEIAGELGLAEDLFEQPIEVDFPNLTKTGLDQFAFVGDGPDDLSRADAALSGERPMSAKRIARFRGHVFAPEEAILPVFIATRLVLLRDYEQQYDAACYATTRLDFEEIHSAEKRLSESGFLDRVIEGRRPETLSPARLRSHRELALENFLKTAWPRIERLSISFGRYQSQGSDPVSPARIAMFLRQFENETRARVALRVLEGIDFKDRKFFADALENFLSEALQRHPVDFVCPLGSTGDSSSLLYYLMYDLPPGLRRQVLPLELALERENLTNVLLWDDFCGAGGHTITTLSQWLNLNDEEALEEYLVDPLTAARRGRFDRTQISISFGLGMNEGLDSINQFVRRHNLNNVTVLAPATIAREDKGVFTQEGLFKTLAEREDFQEFLREKALKVLEPKLARFERPWSREKLENRLLGYGNTGQLLVFYYNVPTVTLTGLWEVGDSWQPLFPRRTKPALLSGLNLDVPVLSDHGDVG